jgi:hypothetical protein
MFYMEPIVYESCHSIWHFDPDRMRFRRMLKGIGSGHGEVLTEWRPYFGLEVDRQGEYFVVLLNAEGSRLLRSWRHTTDCTECGGHVTSEHSLEDLRSALEDSGSGSLAFSIDG